MEARRRLEAKAHRYAYSPTGAFPVVTGGTTFAANTAPAYARWDAMAAYEAKDWALRLNVKNLFDRLYWDAIYDNGGFATPGTRRTISLTGEFKF
jgi:catecholate siderophore receptor